MDRRDEAVKAEEDGGVPDSLKGEVSPEGWALYKRMTAMSKEEYLEKSLRESDERLTKELLGRLY